MPRGVVIVFPWAHWDSHPTMHELARELAGAGWRILLISPDGVGTVGPDGARVCASGSGPLGRRLRALAVLAWQRLPATGWRGVVVRWLARPFGWRIRKRYGVVLGVDPLGLVFAAELGRAWNVPLAYASFEILFRDELSAPWEEQLKAAELSAGERVKVALVQDALRGEILCRENNIAPDRLVIVPVAPRPLPIARCDLLRDRIGIPAATRILLMAGSLDAYCSRDLLLSIADVLPENFVLVVHARARGTARRERFLERLSAHPRIAVSRDILPIERLHELYSSADYALVSYSPNPEGWTTFQNVLHIGAASGKAAYAAMCGVPLLTSDLPCYRRVFANYRCGAVYERLSDVPRILADLEADHAAHSAEARRWYDTELDPRPGLKKFAAAMESLCIGANP